ncbi:putative FmdB family regulatory protein [Desulfitispora alkaliphila]|uniref:FmdB family zinc ribbon protein n=1 Tax=Desulfitispora alkaliphila TaxID=622674 RepID=UPI003D1EF462
MPRYEYRCKKCGKFELNQKISEEPLKECPKCGDEASRIISGGAGVVYKGSGFYTTDSKNSKSECNTGGCGGSCSFEMGK